MILAGPSQFLLILAGLMKHLLIGKIGVLRIL